MDNYEYIIASLPVLNRDAHAPVDTDAIIAGIREQCGPSDRSLLDTLLLGCGGDGLCEDFYASAFKSRSAFIRGWFRYDLEVRNAKVAYLNKALGRPAGMDVMHIGEEECEEPEEAAAVLATDDILERERGLDRLMWEKAEELTVMDVFDMDAILGFVARLKIIDRWLRLDPQTGREMFRKLVNEIRNTKTK